MPKTVYKTNRSNKLRAPARIEAFRTVMEMLERYQAMTATQGDSAVARLEARHGDCTE